MEEQNLEKGDFVRIDAINAVVVGTDKDENIPEGHIALFFGSGIARRNPKEAKVTIIHRYGLYLQIFVKTG